MNKRTHLRAFSSVAIAFSITAATSQSTEAIAKSKSDQIIVVKGNSFFSEKEREISEEEAFHVKYQDRNVYDNDYTQNKTRIVRELIDKMLIGSLRIDNINCDLQLCSVRIVQNYELSYLEMARYVTNMMSPKIQKDLLDKGATIESTTFGKDTDKHLDYIDVVIAFVEAEKPL